MKTKLLITLIICFGLSSAGHAKSITLTAVSPSPFGRYSKLQLVPSPQLTGTCQSGTMYMESIIGAVDQWRYCNDDGSDMGTGTWGALAGVWTQDASDNVFLTDNTNPDLKVGIGTDTPNAKLHVADNLPGDGNVATLLRLQNTANQASSQIVFEENGQGENMMIRYHSKLSDSNFNRLEFWGILKTDRPIMAMDRDYLVNAGIGVGIGVPTDDDINAKLVVHNEWQQEDILNLVDGDADNNGTANDPVEVFTVVDGGNVGIGTASPSELLDINGQIRIRGGNPGAGKVLTSDSNGVTSWEAGGTSGYEIVNEVGPTSGTLTANCPAGKKVTGGGCITDDDPIMNYPSADGSGWNCEADAAPVFNAYAICMYVN